MRISPGPGLESGKPSLNPSEVRIRYNTNHFERSIPEQLVLASMYPCEFSLKEHEIITSRGIKAHRETQA
jgi:hypothetical protein